MRCTIRPRPIRGESLTSYIMRIAEINCLSFIDVWRQFNSFFQRTHMKDAIQLDIHHKRVVSMKNISMITGLQNDQLETMSLSLLIEKYYGDVDVGLHRRDFMMRLYTTKHRKFCLDCLKEKVAYKLIWQISEVSHCLKHKKELISSCSNCKKEQPYIWRNMVFGKCNFCNCDLTVGRSALVGNLEEYVEQERIHQDWNYALFSSNSIIPRLCNENKLSMAISFLYLNKCSNKQVLQKDENGKLSRYVRGKGDSFCVTFPLLLKVIRKLEIRLNDYSKIGLSEQEIKRIREPEILSNDKVIGHCLAPWCKSFGTSKKMSITSFLSSKLFINENYYTDIRICTDCFLRYGINKESGSWEECDQVIECGFNKIRPLLNELRSINSIKVQSNLNLNTLHRFTGYLCYHQLITSEAISRYVIFKERTEIVSSFEKLKQIGKSMFHSSRDIFGWGGIEYWYYHSMPAVQKYLYINANRKRGRRNTLHRSDELAQIVELELKNSSENGNPINPEIIMQVAGCNSSTLTRYKLHNKIKQAGYEQELKLKSYFYKITNEYVEAANNNCKKFTNDDLFSHLGKSKKWIQRRFPDLLIHLDKLRVENRKLVDKARADEIFEKVKDIIPKMLANGEPPYLKSIRNKLEKLGERYFLLDLDKDLRKRVKALLEQAYT